MENILASYNINMHIVLIAKIYKFDITINNTNNYDMHFFDNFGSERSINLNWKFFYNHYWKNKMVWFCKRRYT